MHKTVRTPRLEIGYLEHGPGDGPVLILLHGWPSDVHDWDEVAPVLAAEGWRVLVPWLRGFGPTRFLHAATPRSGQQAALGTDLREFMDTLRIGQATLAGYDWGGRAACVVAALWPERVTALLSITGYNIQAIARSLQPAEAAHEHRLWYQWYFNTERGAAGIRENRDDIARLLWRLWSPNWAFSPDMFAATAASFATPDFAAVTIHSYRHRYGNAEGDPGYDEAEQRLAGQPSIAAPTIVLHGDCDGVGPASHSADAVRHFTGFYDRRVIPRAGHFLPREAPQSVVQALRDLARV